MRRDLRRARKTILALCLSLGMLPATGCNAQSLQGVMGIVQQVLPLVSGLLGGIGGGGGGGQAGLQLGGNTLQTQNQTRPNFATRNQGGGFQPVRYGTSTAGTSASPSVLGGPATTTGGARTTANP